MKRFAVIVALLTAAFVARADDGAAPHRYAVLSLIGDAITVVTYVPHTGTNLDRNRQEAIPIADATFDQIAMRAVQRAVAGIDRSARVRPLEATSKDLFSEERKLFDGSHVMLGDALAGTLRDSGATQLILVTKHRAQAHAGGPRREFGEGYLQGLGFYIDKPRPRQPGFIVPYAYLKVSLVDLATASVLREEAVTATRTVSAARAEDRDPWDALSPEEKTKILRQMVANQVERATSRLLGGATPGAMTP